MNELGHESLAMLKWDIEGFEWDLLRDALHDKQLRGRLPRQMLFELHYRSHMRARTSWWHRERHAGELALLAIDLYEAGYRVVTAHANRGCASCFEYGLLRTRCPVPAQGDEHEGP